MTHSISEIHASHAPLDAIPPFMTMRLDQTLLRPFSALHGGKGSVQARRALDVPVFLGPWGYVDHLLIPPGASMGPSTLMRRSAASTTC